MVVKKNEDEEACKAYAPSRTTLDGALALASYFVLRFVLWCLVLVRGGVMSDLFTGLTTNQTYIKTLVHVKTLYCTTLRCLIIDKQSNLYILRNYSEMRLQRINFALLGSCHGHLIGVCNKYYEKTGKERVVCFIRLGSLGSGSQEIIL
jgi:hypothetical protein